MAEGWVRHLLGDQIEPFSAGILKAGLHPLAVKVMAEAGVDIRSQISKTLSDLPALEFDRVITLCAHAHETCPRFPGRTEILHAGFDDPPYLSRNARTEEEALVHFRRVRDEIRAFVETLPTTLELPFERKHS